MRLLIMIPSLLTWMAVFLGAIEAGLSKKSFIVGITSFVIFMLCIVFEIRSYKKQQNQINRMANNLKTLSASFDKFSSIVSDVKNKH